MLDSCLGPDRTGRAVDRSPAAADHTDRVDLAAADRTVQAAVDRSRPALAADRTGPVGLAAADRIVVAVARTAAAAADRTVVVAVARTAAAAADRIVVAAAVAESRLVPEVAVAADRTGLAAAVGADPTLVAAAGLAAVDRTLDPRPADFPSPAALQLLQNSCSLGYHFESRSIGISSGAAQPRSAHMRSARMMPTRIGRDFVGFFAVLTS